MREKIAAIEKEVNKVILGKEDVIKKFLSVILAGGHILLEDIPGVGKTTLALAFSNAQVSGSIPLGSSIFLPLINTIISIFMRGFLVQNDFTIYKSHSFFIPFLPFWVWYPVWYPPSIRKAIRKQFL